MITTSISNNTNCSIATSVWFHGKHKKLFIETQKDMKCIEMLLKTQFTAMCRHIHRPFDQSFLSLLLSCAKILNLRVLPTFNTMLKYVSICPSIWRLVYTTDL